MIEVKCISEADPLEFEVVAREGNGESRHRVAMTRATWQRLTSGKHAQLVPMPRRGGALLLVSTDSDGNPSLIRTGPLVCFEQVTAVVPRLPDMRSLPVGGQPDETLPMMIDTITEA